MTSRFSAIFIFKLFITAGLIYWLSDNGLLDIAAMKSLPLHPAFYVGILILILSIMLQIVRWWWLLRIQNAELRIKQVTRWTLIGEFFGLVLPGGAGTDLARGYYVLKFTTISKTASLSTILMDRLLGFFGLILVGLPAAVYVQFTGSQFGQFIHTISLGIICIALVGTLAFAALPSQRLFNISMILLPKKFRQSIIDMRGAYVNAMGVLCGSLILSIASQVLFCALFFIAAVSLGISLQWSVAAITFPGVMVANALPITPGGIGVAETASALLFREFGVAEGATIMASIRVWLLLLQGVGAILYLFGGHDLKIDAATSKALGAKELPNGKY